MRKYYLDNLRWISILLLFPIHTAVLYFPKEMQSLNFSSIRENEISMLFFTAITPTLMALLFLIAGITTEYSLRSRTYGEYITERAKKLLLPFFVGLVTIIPFMYYNISLEAGDGNGFKSFITSYFSDTFGMLSKNQHLWFILCLFLVSLIALIFIAPARRRNFKISTDRFTTLGVILLGLPFLLLGKFVGFGATVTLSGAIILVLIGYFFFSDKLIKEKLASKCWLFLGAFIILTIVNIILYINGSQTTIGLASYRGSFLYPYYGMATQWLGVLTLLSLGAKYLEVNSSFTNYMSKASFAIYIFHFPSLILAAYIFAPLVNNQAIQFLVINGVGFVFCMMTYEFIRRIPAFRFLFGIGSSFRK